jgi:Tannase and feruloyl esterase
MQQVINWVENGQAPATLAASGSINGTPVTRPLCPYPDPDAIYTGGDPTVAASYSCSSKPQFTNPSLLNGQGRPGWTPWGTALR